MINDDVQQLINSAIAALRAGDRHEGRRLLFLATNADPRSEAAWLMLSDLMETRYERRDCLEKVLQINPDNIEARAALEEILSGAVTKELTHPFTPPPAEPASGVELRQEFLGATVRQSPAGGQKATGRGKPEKRREPRGKMSTGQIVILAILGVAALGVLVVAGIFVVPNLLRYSSLLAKPTQLSAVTQPSATPRATWTTAPTEKVVPTRTPRPSATARKSPTPTKSIARAETRTPLTPTPTTTLAPGATRTLKLIQRIGPIVAGDQSTYNLLIAITGVRFTMGGSREPKTGDYRYIVIDLKITNQGPDIAPGIGNFGFYLRDNQGVLHYPTMRVYMAQKCFLGTADIEVRESHSGCIAFDATMIGGMALVYQPVWDDPDFLLTFPLR